MDSAFTSVTTGCKIKDIQDKIQNLLPKSAGQTPQSTILFLNCL